MSRTQPRPGQTMNPPLQSAAFTTPVLPQVESSAIISPCGLYRYQLVRSWGEGDRVNFVMLNPSTASATEDDPTIRRCVGFAKAWGYDGIVVTNLYAFRATKTAELWKALNPIGTENDRYIEHAATCKLVVAAWGTHGAVNNRGRVVLRHLEVLGRAPRALGLTKDQHPRHPLYARSDSVLVPVPTR